VGKSAVLTLDLVPIIWTPVLKALEREGENRRPYKETPAYPCSPILPRSFVYACLRLR
jgi:hypothetical protein